MQLNTLHDLFVNELMDTYDAEMQITDSMPKMIKAANSQELKDKFQRHMNETQDQISRLEDIFEMLDINPEREECMGMKGILEDGSKVIDAKGDPNVIDAALIAAAQKVEHYEISSYGTLRAFAQTMGHDDIAKELDKTLRQESFTDEMLSKFAESRSNVRSPQM
ncbi:MAG: ferritin-like domain-containing protein [Armatimonadota bacterium]